MARPADAPPNPEFKAHFLHCTPSPIATSGLQATWEERQAGLGWDSASLRGSPRALIPVDIPEGKGGWGQRERESAGKSVTSMEVSWGTTRWWTHLPLRLGSCLPSSEAALVPLTHLLLRFQSCTSGGHCPCVSPLMSFSFCRRSRGKRLLVSPPENRVEWTEHKYWPK